MYDEGAPVTLTAPATYNDGGTIYNFIRWRVDDVPQASGRTITVSLAADSTASAAYMLPGPAFSIWRTQSASEEKIMAVDDASGNVFAMGSFLATSLDLAEKFTAGEAMEAGSVVVIDPTGNAQLKLCRQAYDSAAAGIISQQPGLLLGSGIGAVTDGKASLALAGRTPCKVDASYGAINVGDLLTTSPTPGCAMKADPAKIVPGCIIGKALESLDNGVGVIKVIVSLQ